MSEKEIKKSNIRKLGTKKSGKGGSSYFITLPKNLVKELKWRTGKKLVVKKLDNNRLVIENFKS